MARANYESGDSECVSSEVIVHSPTGKGTARVLRTDGCKIPYEDNVAHVTFENLFGDTLYMRPKGIRTITVSWIGERFVHINKGVGRIVSIEEIYDLVERDWLVQHTVSYHLP